MVGIVSIEMFVNNNKCNEESTNPAKETVKMYKNSNKKHYYDCNML